MQVQEDLENCLREECGVFGIYDLDGNDVASTIYYGLFALQHRGQESCGIAVSDTNGPKGKASILKGMGLVNEVFVQEDLEKLTGNIGIGHVRYSTAGSSTRENAQPLLLNYIKGTLGLAHNVYRKERACIYSCFGNLCTRYNQRRICARCRAWRNCNHYKRRYCLGHFLVYSKGNGGKMYL